MTPPISFQSANARFYLSIFYRPHLRDGEGNVFTGVLSVHTPGVPQSQVLSQVCGPRSFRGGGGGGAPQPGQGWGAPWPWQDWGTTQPGQVWDTPPWPEQDWGTPPETEQQSKYLPGSGRYASCGHARGLPCTIWFGARFSVEMTAEFGLGVIISPMYCNIITLSSCDIVASVLHCVKLFFVNLLLSPAVWLFDIWHLSDNLTPFWQFEILLTFWHKPYLTGSAWRYFLQEINTKWLCHSLKILLQS